MLPGGLGDHSLLTEQGGNNLPYTNIGQGNFQQLESSMHHRHGDGLIKLPLSYSANDYSELSLVEESLSKKNRVGGDGHTLVLAQS
jgi:hypothetical protein